MAVATSSLTEAALDEILALQVLVGWAGEGLCRPKRLGWWETDLIDPDGGGDLLARLAPRTYALPPAAETEFVANSFLDFEGAAMTLMGAMAAGASVATHSG